MASRSPRLSCIVTTFNEGPLAALSINSLLAQSFEDFEILVVDDGASEATRTVLQGFDDPRIRHIRQANDGLSSARNRALQTACGDYVCFLDADDTRPPWAFGTMMAATSDDPDCVFSPGILQELRNEALPFYDERHFAALRAEGLMSGSAASDHKALRAALHHLICIEPQSANKLVRRDFITRYRLRFPSGLFFEDMLFHAGIVMNMESYAITELPAFTYFRRYAHRQITSTNSGLRFDAISTATNTLHLFASSRYFQDATLRALMLASTFKLLKWSAESVSYEQRHSFEQALKAMIIGLDQRYLYKVDDKTMAQVKAQAPWVEPSLQFMMRASPALH